LIFKAFCGNIPSLLMMRLVANSRKILREWAASRRFLASLKLMIGLSLRSGDAARQQQDDHHNYRIGKE